MSQKEKTFKVVRVGKEEEATFTSSSSMLMRDLFKLNIYHEKWGKRQRQMNLVWALFITK